MLGEGRVSTPVLASEGMDTRDKREHDSMRSRAGSSVPISRTGQAWIKSGNDGESEPYSLISDATLAPMGARGGVARRVNYWGRRYHSIRCRMIFCTSDVPS